MKGKGGYYSLCASRPVFLLGGMILSLLSVKSGSAAGERFAFGTTTGTLGFGQPHNVELRGETSRPLVVRSTGRDPFFYSPPVSLLATKRGALVVRAAFEGPVRALRLYFATDKSPNTDEDKALMVPVRADGKEREIRLPVGEHPLWQGTITRYRFDLEPGEAPGAVMRLSSIAYEFPAEPTMNKFISAASVLGKGTTSSLAVEIENRTPYLLSDVEVRFQPSTHTVSVSPAQVAVGRLAPDERMSVQATVRGERDGVAALDAIMLRKGVELDRDTLAMDVATSTPEPGMPDWGIHIRPGGSPWAVVKARNQALVIGLDGQSGLAEWWATRGDHYVRVGRIFPFVSLLHGEREGRQEIVRWRSCREDTETSRRLVLVGEMGTGAQKVADVEARWQPAEKDPWISAEITLTAQTRLLLRSFASPKLLVGDGAFGSERDEGLLPGVEYLEKGEQSSSKADYHTEEYLRTVPHPKKITASLLAITHGDLLLALMWPRPQASAAGLSTPAAGFASPNFVDSQKNHLMTLFWPSVPSFVPENGWESRQPVEMKPGERLTLRYELVAIEKAGIHVADIFPVWFQRNGKPTLQTAPRDHDAERALCRVAYTEVAWREKELGWNHALPASGGQWAPQPYTFNIQFLESERAEMTSGPERNRVHQVLEQGAAHRWKQGGERPGGDDYYFVGEHIIGCIDARQAHARALMQRQNPDGSWGFEPRGEQQAELGPKGQTEIGIVADRAIPILQYALATGDRDAEAAARKALENMKHYIIPRAAQVWEIPVHTPDIMGSARGATAFRLGYLLTGEKTCLDRADYWLATGLPFVYFWEHPQWSYWYFATTPVFGATHFRAPNWEGLPVQWCGLVYAEEALRCADLKEDALYKTIGEGIVRSAMWQQPTEGEYRGLLPDSYAFASKQGNPPFINPETILRPLWLVRGFDFRVNSVVVPRGADRSLRVSALAQIGAGMADDRSVTVTLSAVRGLPFGVLICGVPLSPQGVFWQGKPVAKREKLERNEPGWRHLTERGWVLINLPGTGVQEKLTVGLTAK